MSLKKTVKREAAHATFQTPNGEWTWYVLKAWQAPKGEATNKYARWFCLVTSPMVGETGEMGDVYVAEIRDYARLIDCTQEWADAYNIVKVTRG